MTTHDKDKIIYAMKEAGFDIWVNSVGPVPNWIERFYAAAFEAGRQAEREACAKVCELIGLSNHGEGRDDSEAYDCADAISARGDTK